MDTKGAKSLRSTLSKRITSRSCSSRPCQCHKFDYACYQCKADWYPVYKSSDIASDQKVISGMRFGTRSTSSICMMHCSAKPWKLHQNHGSNQGSQEASVLIPSQPKLFDKSHPNYGVKTDRNSPTRTRQIHAMKQNVTSLPGYIWPIYMRARIEM